VARALVARAFGASYLVLVPVSKCALNQPAHVLVFMRASYAFYLCNGHDVGIDVGFCSNPSHTDELTCSALDAIRLRFVPRDALSNTAVHEVMPCPSQYLLISHSFLRILTVCTVCVCVCVCVRIQSFKFYPPLYAHQIFGEDECIYGYFSPEIDITYSEDSLLPAITFTHIPQQGYEHAAWSAPPGNTLHQSNTNSCVRGVEAIELGELQLKKKLHYNPISNFRVFVPFRTCSHILCCSLYNCL